MLLLGGGLYAALYPFLPLNRDLIQVNARTVQTLVEQREDMLARELAPEEWDRVIQEHVDEEILVHEAYRRGLHMQEGNARARLLRRMRLALSEGIPQPSRSQLRAYYATNSARYQTGESVSFAHVFWARGSDNLPTDPAAPLDALVAGADFTTMGERFWLGPILEQVPGDRLAAALGSEFAEHVFDLDPDIWAGPIESSQGTHYVRVLERHPPSIPDFEIVEERVAFDWLNEKRSDLMDRRMSRMYSGYRIEVEGRDGFSAGEGEEE